jgi:TusE/DsrC/DsvC family sulfur relay protein
MMQNATLAGTPENPALEQLAREEEGYLLNADDWFPGLIEPLAVEEGLRLTPERREIIRYIRAYFEQNASVPEARRLLKHMESTWGRDRANRRYLYRLFPRGYGQQACKQTRRHAQAAQADAGRVKRHRRVAKILRSSPDRTRPPAAAFSRVRR